MIHFQCPQCNQSLKAPPDQASQLIRCPYCRTKFVPGESIISGNGVAKTTEIEPQISKQPTTVATALIEGPVDGRLSRPSMTINQEELIDMTAMVDIVFFLLIFFLVTSMSAIMSSAALPRPESQNDDGQAKAARADEPQKDSNAIVVRINKDDAIEIDGVPFREITDVIIRFRQMRDAGGAETSVLIVGHGDASHGTAAAVLDAGYEAGISHLRLAVLDEPE